VPADFLGKTAFEAGLRIVDGEAMTPQSEAFEIRGPFRKLRYKYTSHGEEQYWAISGSPVFDASGRFAGYRGTGSNVSAEIRSQQALLEAKTTSELASRAKSEFLANMSHELRTPLNAIIGFSEVIKDRLFGAALDRYVDYARDIFNSGTHLLAIINDILDLSKIEAGQTELYEEEIEIEGVTESVVQVLRQKIDAGKLTLKLDLSAGLPTIFADERKLKQILMNLLSNAVKFTPAGGRVTVSASLDDAGNLRLVVTDTGIGMAPEEIPRALAAFVQIDSSLSRRHEGTGLGLPLAKALAELHGGQLDLISTPGRGTSVIVTLPRSRLRLAAAE
jgi:signal transduction histidine kinase